MMTTNGQNSLPMNGEFSTSPVHLPSEILDLVVELTNDASTLKSWRLVCHSFSQRALVNIWSEVNIQIGSQLHDPYSTRVVQRTINELRKDDYRKCSLVQRLNISLLLDHAEYDLRRQQIFDINNIIRHAKNVEKMWLEVKAFSEAPRFARIDLTTITNGKSRLQSLAINLCPTNYHLINISPSRKISLHLSINESDADRGKVFSTKGWKLISLAVPDADSWIRQFRVADHTHHLRHLTISDDQTLEKVYAIEFPHLREFNAVALNGHVRQKADVQNVLGKLASFLSNHKQLMLIRLNFTKEVSLGEMGIALLLPDPRPDLLHLCIEGIWASMEDLHYLSTQQQNLEALDVKLFFTERVNSKHLVLDSIEYGQKYPQVLDIFSSNFRKLRYLKLIGFQFHSETREYRIPFFSPESLRNQIHRLSPSLKLLCTTCLDPTKSYFDFPDEMVFFVKDRFERNEDNRIVLAERLLRQVNRHISKYVPQAGIGKHMERLIMEAEKADGFSDTMWRGIDGMMLFNYSPYDLHLMNPLVPLYITPRERQ